MNEKLVVVAGAAGKLGRLVVDELLVTPGVKVRALVRDPKKAEVASMASLLGPKENGRYPHIEADDVARALARGVI